MPENEDTTYYAVRAKNEKLERLVEELKQRLEVQHRLNQELTSERDGLAESLNSLLGSSNERADAQRDQIRELERLRDDLEKQIAERCVEIEKARSELSKHEAHADRVIKSLTEERDQAIGRATYDRAKAADLQAQVDGVRKRIEDAEAHRVNMEGALVDMETARDRARKQRAEAEAKVATYQREAAACAAEAVSARHDADHWTKMWREADARARKWRRAFKALVRGLR